MLKVGYNNNHHKINQYRQNNNSAKKDRNVCHSSLSSLNLSFGANFLQDKNDKIGISQEVYLAGKDSRSARLNSSAKRVINVFYHNPQRFSDYLTTPSAIKDAYFALLKDKPCATDLSKAQKENLPFLLNSLKDSNGRFNIQNEEFLYSLIQNSVPFYIFAHLDPELLANIINFSKDENGVVDSKKAEFALDMQKHIVNLDAVCENLSVYYDIPENKRDFVYNKLSKIGSNEKYRALNFATFAKFCVDKNGDFIQDRLDFCLKFSKFSPMQFPKEVFDLAEKYPHLRKFIYIFSKNTEFSETQRLKRYIEENIRPDGSMSIRLRQKLIDFTHFAHTSIPFDDFYAKCFDNKGRFNEKLFDNALNIMISEKRLESNNNIITTDIALDVVNNELSVDKCDYQQRILLLNSLNSIRRFPDISPLVSSSIEKLEKSFAIQNVAIPIDNITRKNFVDNILAVKQDKFTDFEKLLTECIPILENMPNGLPMKYSRAQFLFDISNLCETKDELNQIMSKMNISPLFSDDDNLVGYNGLIFFDKLDKNNSTEKAAFDLAHKFIFENEVCSDNPELNSKLNIILSALPEFINVVGKKQHKTQKYSIDIHTLLVLAYSLENPDYLNKLNSQDKATLKMLCLFHDLGKKEGVVDHGHQYLSANYSSEISKKLITSTRHLERLNNLIESHHWLAQYNTAQNKDIVSQELAFKFRHNNDFEIAKIVAKSDLKGVSHDFYSKLAYCFNQDFLRPIQDNLDFLYGTGNALFSHGIVNKSKIKQHLVNYKGVDYPVINLRKIDDEANMGDFGFEYGVKKKDLKLLVHMIGNHNRYADLVSLKLLGQNASSGAVSESLITPKNNTTYQNRKFGVLLSQDNMNISAINSRNQGSGYKKDIRSFVDEIFHPQAWENRQKFRNTLLKNLNLDSNNVTFAEFAEFYKNILSDKTSLSQIVPYKTYKIGKNEILGSDLINALQKYQESLIDASDASHNEIIGFAPRIQGLVAKVEGLYLVPREFLDFANENNLPIILI